MYFTLLGLLVLAFWLYCILDVAMADQALVRNLPRLVWLVLVVVAAPVGGIAWLVAGRPTGVRARPGSTDRRPARRAPDAPRGPLGPDDDPDFLRRLDERLHDDD